MFPILKSASRFSLITEVMLCATKFCTLSLDNRIESAATNRIMIEASVIANILSVFLIKQM